MPDQFKKQINFDCKDEEVHKFLKNKKNLGLYITGLIRQDMGTIVDVDTKYKELLDSYNSLLVRVQALEAK